MDNKLVDLTRLYEDFFNKKYLFLSLSVLVFLLSLMLYFFQPIRYVSSVVLLENNFISKGTLSSDNSILSLAGLNSGKRSYELEFALENMKSKDFLEDFIIENDLLIDLFYIQGWDENKKRNIYKKEPSKISEDELKEFSGSDIKSKILKDLKIKSDGLSNWEVSFSSKSPIFSKLFLDNFVDSINAKTKDKFLSYSKNIQTNYLAVSRNITNIDIRNTFQELLKNELQKSLYTESMDDYVFVTVESASIGVLTKFRMLIIFFFLEILVFFIFLLYLVFLQKELSSFASRVNEKNT